ncbi:hypothetical protein HK104_009469 [Borealophlyctis nickersoniae]|nr:hypothetical protein HK104_009469 [Borealophlyctis nickersoniae]
MKVAILALSAMVPSALAHGWVNEPPTRGEIEFGTRNERGFPLSGKKSCTTLPKRSPPTKLSPGPLTIKMQFNDGANHVGMCTVFIADSDGKNMKKIGEMQDCARSLHKGPGNKGDAPIKAEMTVNVPAGGCGDAQQCMLFWTLAATHISTTNPEIYDDCMDVTISGSGGGNNNSGGNNNNNNAGGNNNNNAGGNNNNNSGGNNNNNGGNNNGGGNGPKPAKTTTTTTVEKPTEQPTNAPQPTKAPQPGNNNNNGGSKSESDSNCGAAWDQCGGKDFNGPTCCQNKMPCVESGEWWSMCTPNEGENSGSENEQ